MTFYYVFDVRCANMSKVLICASTIAIQTFDTNILIFLYKYYYIKIERKVKVKYNEIMENKFD